MALCPRLSSVRHTALADQPKIVAEVYDLRRNKNIKHIAREYKVGWSKLENACANAEKSELKQGELLLFLLLFPSGNGLLIDLELFFDVGKKGGRRIFSELAE